VGKQGQTAINKVNIINMIKGLIYSAIFRNMTGYCKLMAQNWHKSFPSHAHMRKSIWMPLTSCPF